MAIAKYSLIALIIILSGIYAILAAQEINMTTADLGRHLKNGELFIKNFSIPQENYYSYTNPDHPFINHHWASGVVFFITEQFFGFKGLSVFFVSASILTFLIFFQIAAKYSSPTIAAVVSAFIIPVIAGRTEIRPEVFSYLFCALFFWILWNHSRGNLNWRWLFVLPIIEIFWVNFHIYFFLGPALIGAFLTGDILSALSAKNKETGKRLKRLFAVLAASGLAALINPAGVSGVLYPLKIFNNYGYRLFENQSVWFIEKLVNYPPAFYFKLVFAVVALSWLAAFYAARKNKTELPLANLLITIAFGAAGWLMVRNFALFGLFALPIAAINLKSFAEKESDGESKEYFSAAVLAIIIVIALIIVKAEYWRSKNIGLGIEPNANAAIEFFKKENLVGPIFNNYDVGGYLIYYLFPREKVFVDNRPEAYPSLFFQNVYIPMQENNEKWREELARYSFNVIFFYKNDMTPWAQSFLIKRISDPDWAPVFVDNQRIIFLRRVDKNREVIKKYELPRTMFNISQNP